MATIDYIHGNYQSSGSVAARLLRTKMDMDCLRPFVGKDGHSYVTVTTDEIDGKTGRPKKRAVRTNNAALLKRDDWITIDEEVLAEAMPQLRLVGDLRARALGRATGADLADHLREIVGAIAPLIREALVDQCVDQLLHARVAVARLLGECLHADRVEAGRNRWIDHARRHDADRTAVALVARDLLAERMLARDQFIQHDAERKDVRTRRE